MPEVTTIKVSKALRARITADAAAVHMTAQGFLEHVLDGYERSRRLAAVEAAYRATNAEERQKWIAETSEWDAADSDGLTA